MKPCCLVFAFALSLCAQGPAFEVASVKPAQPGGQRVSSRGGPGTESPTRWTCTNCNLTQIITDAWDLRYFQISGPGWLDEQRFEISATVTPGASVEQFRLMKRALLEERFGLKAHLEARETQVYDLVVAKGGAKLTITATPEPDPAEPAPLRRPPTFDRNGVPQIPPGVSMAFSDGLTMKKQAVRETVAQLAGFLSGQLSKPVYDTTGLTGKYDYLLVYAQDGAGDSAEKDDATPGLFQALQSQLGLRLESRKGSADFIVVDSIERSPTGN